MFFNLIIYLVIFFNVLLSVILSNRSSNCNVDEVGQNRLIRPFSHFIRNGLNYIKNKVNGLHYNVLCFQFSKKILFQKPTHQFPKRHKRNK